MSRRTGRPAGPYAMAALALVPAIWLGLLVGVSFIATPVKFAAPTLELGPALDVGRVTFALFSKIEWGVAGILALVVIAAGFQGVDEEFNITTLGRGGSDTTATALAAVLQTDLSRLQRPPAEGRDRLQ